MEPSCVSAESRDAPNLTVVSLVSSLFCRRWWQVLGLAVSTSHCLVGAIIGIGLCDRFRGSTDAELNIKMILRILIGWAATIPLAMLVSVLVFVTLMPSYPPTVC